jgi:hypothetical protein
MDKQQARQSIEELFRKRIDRDVSGLATDYCLDQNLQEAAKLCQESHNVISERLWSQFSFNWTNVFPNPGGTIGLAGQFINDKLEFTLLWAASNGLDTSQVLHAEKTVLERLSKLWNEWAGYMVTSSSDLEVALD